MEDKELSISLQDLTSLPESPLPPLSDFLIYLNDPARQVEKVELLAIDTKEMPRIPLRRQACGKCVSQALTCERCSECKGKKQACCRSLACLYDYEAYQQARESPLYKACKCLKGLAPSCADFQVDWRLLALIMKLPETRSKSHKFYLHSAPGGLWATEQLPSAYDEGVSAIVHEDNFGVFSFHERQTRESSAPSLAESNCRHLCSLLKLHVRRFLSTKEAWEVSNLEEECLEIADNFLSHKKLEGIKLNLQSQAVDNLYANMPSLKFQGKYTQAMISSAKSPDRDYRDCSDWSNEEILFSYCAKSQLIFVCSARYFEEDAGAGHVRGLRVRWLKEALKAEAVWFKDRKGDLFAISRGTLSIFKFHLPSKSFEQFQIDANPLLAGVDSPAALLYVPQRDTVYYFHKELRKSFYFTLYRPKGEKGEKGEEARGKNPALSKHSCTSATFYPDFLAAREKSLPRGGAAVRALYVMEDYKFKGQGKEMRRELVPVIYLLCERKAYLPLGVGVYRIVHHDDSLVFVELPASEAARQPGDTVRSPNFSAGVHFVLRIEKGLRLCLYTLLEGKSALLTAQVVSCEDKDSLAWVEEFMELTGCMEPRQGLGEAGKVEGHMLCSANEAREFKHPAYSPILLTDFAGAPGNNEYRLLGENSKTGRVVEVAVSCVEGAPQWRLFDLA